MSSVISYALETEFSSKVLWDDFHYAILESPSEVRFADLMEIEDGISLEKYASGLLFGPRSELRWRQRRNGKYHLVYIHDSGQGWPESEPVRLFSDGAHGQIVLWGEPQTDTEEPVWYEGRIPRSITEYPRRFKGKRVAVRTIPYRLSVQVPESGSDQSITKSLFLFRCAGLEPVEEDL